MCGIFGVIAKQVGVPVEGYIKRASDVLAHRGPDDFGCHIEDGRAFANYRLAIVDVTSGKQPMYTDNGNRGIVYNGEVYNFEDLRAGLQKMGYAFETKSDTEVVLKAFDAYGENSFPMLNGMFAFCIWDQAGDTVYLVRDRFGIKPLYIYEDDRQIIFSSELKGILALPELDLSLDPMGFQDYLRFRYVQSPYTFFRRITRLEPGTYIKIKGGNAVHYRFFDIRNYAIDYSLDTEACKKRLAQHIETAVKSQLMGEVPVGVLLSGGLDSSTISYYVNKCGAKLKTFNIGFPEVNEFQYSSAVAKQLGLEHIEITMTVQDLVDSFDSVMWAIDEPIADPACLPLYYLCQELKKHVTVVLSGEGADELFAGYNQYRFSMLDPQPYEQRFDHFAKQSFYFADYSNFIRDEHLPDLTSRFRKYFEEQDSRLNGMLAYDVKTWIPEDLMMKADKILMAHSLEGRFPFLDNDLFAYAAQLPPEYKLSDGGETKWILKELMKGQLPSKVIGRKKMGFTVPVEALLEGLKPAVTAAFDKIDGSELDTVLKTGEIRQLVSRYYGGDKSVSALQVWSMFVLCYWFVNVRPRLKNTKGYRLPGRRQYLRERSLDTTPENKEKIRRRMSNKYIYGNGIEVGALHCPLWTSNRANVRYVDIASEEYNMKKYPELNDFHFTHVDIIDDGEKLDRIPVDSLDFIIANHFLEHTHNPIGTIRNHLSRVKKNGNIFYAIPIKDYTFDRERPVTSWAHLQIDDSDGGASSKYDHYLEWAYKVDHVKEETKAIEHARLLMSRDERIHFHVWDTESFEKFINLVRDYLGNPFEIVDFFENYEEIIVVIQRR